MIDINKDCYKWLRNYYNNKWLFLGDIKYTAQETKEISKAIIEFDEKTIDKSCEENYIKKYNPNFYKQLTSSKILDFNKIIINAESHILSFDNLHWLTDITGTELDSISYKINERVEYNKKMKTLLKFDKNISLSLNLHWDLLFYKQHNLINISNDITKILNKNDFTEHLHKIKYNEPQSYIILDNNITYFYTILTRLPEEENLYDYDINLFIIDFNNKIQYFSFCYNYDETKEDSEILSKLISPCPSYNKNNSLASVCERHNHIYDWCHNKHLHLTNEEYDYKIRGRKYITKDVITLSYRTSEDNISDKEAYDIFKFIVNFEVFKNFAEIKTEVKNLSNKDVQETKNLSRYEKNKKSIIPITFMDKTFYTTSINNNDFMVNGHFRMQKIGKNRSDVKLIWIDNFTKHGYIRKAKLEKLNNS